jgi:hypothetical protein
VRLFVDASNDGTTSTTLGTRVALLTVIAAGRI